MVKRSARKRCFGSGAGFLGAVKVAGRNVSIAFSIAPPRVALDFFVIWVVIGNMHPWKAMNIWRWYSVFSFVGHHRRSHRCAFRPGATSISLRCATRQPCGPCVRARILSSA
jgi:hypothetical protein